MIILFLTFGMVSCTHVAIIKVQLPGEIKIANMSKIALIDFNTITSKPNQGIYAANPEIVELAKGSLFDIFYKMPFYSMVDINFENHIESNILNMVKRDSIFDAFLYGKLWWQLSKEYQNIKPDKYNLSHWKVVKYQYGKTDKGEKLYTTKTLTTLTKDKLFKRHYRVKKCTLKLSLTLYRVKNNGEVIKSTQLTEVATRDAIIDNRKFTLNKPIMISAIKKQTRSEMLKTKQSVFSNFSSFLGLKGKSKEIQDDYKVARNIQTIPNQLEFQIDLLDLISKKLNELTVPHLEEFEVQVLSGTDSKSLRLIQCSAYSALEHYLVYKLSKYPDYTHFFEEAFDPLKGAESVIQRDHKEYFDKKNKDNPEKVYKPLPNEDVKEQANDYLEDHIVDLFNLGLALEATGKYERALEVFRFAYHQYRPLDLKYADEIGRCLLALDMNDRVQEVSDARDDAISNTKIIGLKNDMLQQIDEEPVLVSTSPQQIDEEPVLVSTSPQQIDEEPVLVSTSHHSESEEVINEDVRVKDNTIRSNNESKKVQKDVPDIINTETMQSIDNTENAAISGTDITDAGSKSATKIAVIDNQSVNDTKNENKLEKESTYLFCSTWNESNFNNASSEIKQLLYDWSEAWSTMNVQKYLSFYDTSFEPVNGVSRQNWVNQRKKRLNKKSIQVKVNNINIDFLSCSSAKVTFFQQYRANNYHDKSHKVMILVETDNTWKIQKETSKKY